MGEKVAILVGDKSRKFSKVDFLRTKKVGGGNCYWVPESARTTTTKNIDKNGTYKISDEKDSEGRHSYYGYSEVTVNVPNANKAVGKKQDGNTYVVEPNTQGDLTEHIIPDSIRITTEPSTRVYTDGDEISKNGMVVKAYQGDGNLWESEGYTGGVIPNSELNLDPTHASYSQAGDEIYSNGNGVNAMKFAVYYDDALSNYTWYKSEQYTEGIFSRNDPAIGDIYVTLYNGILYICSNYNQSNVGFYYFNGESQTVGTTILAKIFGQKFSGANEMQHLRTIVPESTANPNGVNFDTLVRSGGGQEITVKWERPDDGKILSDTFDISVVPLR